MIRSYGYQLMGWAIISLLLMGCNQSPAERYKAHERKELASGLRKDSLFMGFYFKMPKKEFREYCFEMNLKGKFKQGGRKNSGWVESSLPGTQYPAAINFYPNFIEDSISEMHAAIYYDDDAVFKDGIFERDSLLLDVLNLLDTRYGKETFKIKSPLFYKEDVYVKLNGNRRITIYPDPSGQLINVWFADMTAIKNTSEEK